MKKNGAIILNILLLIFGIAGLSFTIASSGFMNSSTFRYYTVQSNIFAMMTAAVTLYFELRRRRKGIEIPAGAQFLRLIGCIAITLTFLVFSLMLTPQMIAIGQASYLTSPGNLCVHNLVPICSILDWCFFGSSKKLKKASAYCGLLPAFAYLCFVHYCVIKGLTFSGNKVPYFFFNYESFGWFKIGNGGIGVMYWIIILAIVLIALGYAFMAIARKRD